jgi:formylglycine-generating enzyme required for sulfatase activity
MNRHLAALMVVLLSAALSAGCEPARAQSGEEPEPGSAAIAETGPPDEASAGDNSEPLEASAVADPVHVPELTEPAADSRWPAPDDCGTVPDGMACVPGGAFTLGVPEGEDEHRCAQPDMFPDNPATYPAEEVWVETFYMKLTEVTNSEYEACVAARECDDAGPQYMDFSADQQAITGVNWYHASQYCAWIGGRLPTEAEWELAARGPDGETHPWGDEESNCELAIIYDESGRSCGREKRGSRPEAGRVNEVAARAAGRYGLFDMMGNAEEWVADWWSESYDACGADCQGVNPMGPCQGAEECEGYNRRVVRGGSWYWDSGHATGYHRRRHFPDNRAFHHFGFRCAASLDSPENEP